MAGFGIPVPRAVHLLSGKGSPAPARGIDALRPPLVVKAMIPGVVHKSELGAVRTGLGSAADAEAALEEMHARLSVGANRPAGYLVEEMAEPGVELLLGMTDDAAFGRLLAFGAGGTGVEALGEATFFALPLRPADVDSLLAAHSWLEPTLRRLGPTVTASVRDAIWKFGGPDGIGLAPRLAHLELNPLIAGCTGVTAVDAVGELR